MDSNTGVSQTSSHYTHCQFPPSQDAELRAFLNKFLKGNDAGGTNIVKRAQRMDLVEHTELTVNSR